MIKTRILYIISLSFLTLDQETWFQALCEWATFGQRKQNNIPDQWFRRDKRTILVDFQKVVLDMILSIEIDIQILLIEFQRFKTFNRKMKINRNWKHSLWQQCWKCISVKWRFKEEAKVDNLNFISRKQLYRSMQLRWPM